MKPSVSVIIPTFNNWQGLRLCLDALATQSYPSGYFDVFVVNNNASDTCPYKLPAHNMHILTEPKRGSYAARNAGVMSSRGDILAFTDADCIPHHDWIKEGVLCMKHQKKEQLGGHIAFLFKNKRSAAEILDAAIHMDNERSITRHSCAVTANLFVARTIFDTVGLFDSSLESGGDTELTQRLAMRGHPVGYCSKSIVYHPTRNTRQLITKAIRTGKGFVRLEQKRVDSKAKKAKRFFVQLIPFSNPKRISDTIKQHTNPFLLLFIKTMFLSFYVGLVRSASIISYWFGCRLQKK